MKLISLVLMLFWMKQASAQEVISYGAKPMADTILIAQAAPVFKARGYDKLETYIEDKLYQDPRTRMFPLQVIGANALIKFTVDKYGFIKRVDVNCTESGLILPLTRIIDSMPPWKPGIKNDENVSTKMQFYFNITNVEMGQYVVRQERMPPEFDKSTRNLKIVLASAAIAIFAALILL